MLKILAHLFIPRSSNNYRARVLHKSSLLFTVLLLIGTGFIVRYTPKVVSGGQVLGYAANISPEEIIRLTNEKRAQNGLPALSENGVLSRAAAAKAAYMFEKDFWAHVAPDGTTPWSFFKSFGYGYKYAGENLARDFTNASSAVDAWMASPTHRENMLSDKYREIGVAVMDGNLTGSDTTLIVQFFGTKITDSLPVAPVAAAEPQNTVKPTVKPATATTKPKPVATPANVAQIIPTAAPLTATPGTETAVNQQNKGGLGVVLPSSSFTISKVLSFSVIGVLMGTVLVDGFIINRRRVVRVGGRSLAHFAFLGMIFVLILMAKAGSII